MYEVFRIVNWQKELVYRGTLIECQERYRQIIQSGLLATIVPVR
jgi:hypothetical protein